MADFNKLGEALETYYTAKLTQNKLEPRDFHALLETFRAELGVDSAYINIVTADSSGFYYAYVSASDSKFNFEGKQLAFEPGLLETSMTLFDEEHLCTEGIFKNSPSAPKALLYYGAIRNDEIDACIGVMDFHSENRVWTKEERKAVLMLGRTLHNYAISKRMDEVLVFKQQQLLKERNLALRLENIQDDLRAEDERLSQAIRGAARANREKTEFLGNMSHNIRTPMNAVLGFADIAEKNLEDRERVNDCLSKISCSGAQMLDLINDVLDIARIDSGTIVLHEEPVSLTEEFGRLQAMFHAFAMTKGITFSASIKNMTHETVGCDRACSERVMKAILENAIKYTDAGGSITFSMEEVPSRRAGYARYKVIISDTGIGMSPSFLPIATEAFAREETAKKAMTSGTGLGLSLAQNLLILMKGDMDITSVPGKGTTVELTFYGAITEDAVPAKKEEVVPEYTLKGRRVLMAEDNPFNVEMATVILEDAGIQVEAVGDGVALVEKYEASAPRTYDFILTDINMPMMNGYEATKCIRALADKDKAAIPIIAMTASTFEEEGRQALTAGMDGFVSKAIDLQSLTKQIAGAVYNRRRQQEARG